MPGITQPKNNSQLPSTAQLLTMGGDRRIICDSTTGANKYHCQSVPNASLLTYGSATASTISAAAFTAAEQLRERLEETTYAHELQRLREELCQLYGLSDTDIIFASSGTDIHLFAAQLARPDLILMMEAEETGSGVPAALEGKHFSDITVSGNAVVSGASIDGAHKSQVITIASRNADGSLRPAAEVDNAFATLANRAVADGQQVLLILTDLSKTGLMVPSLPCLLGLYERFPEQISILVDACQFRLSAATLQSYLKQGFMVAVTGSKFITGPAFSGALFVPETVSAQLRSYNLPSTLGQYSARADWPDGWEAQAACPDTANYGLLLRWQAALMEMQRFHALPEAAVTHFLERFSQAIKQRLASNNVFAELPVPAHDRPEKTWDNVQTIFPFLLRHASGVWLNRNEMEQIYRRLRKEYSIELGQPVLCGIRNAIPVSALRLCASARLVVDALSPEARGEDAIISDALFILDKAAFILS